MIPAIVLLLKILLAFCLVSLIAGLVRPVYVLWFLDRMNRLKVLYYYGGSLLVIGICILIMEYYSGNIVI